MSFPDPIKSIKCFQILADIARSHLRDSSTVVIGSLPMNLFDFAATEFAVRFEDTQKTTGLDRNMLAHVAH